MSHIAAYFLCNNQREQALEVMQYKKTICDIKQIQCSHLTKELWLVHGYKGVLPFEEQKSGLDSLCSVLSTPSREKWLMHKNKIFESLHPFIFAYLPMLPDDVISDQEIRSFHKRGSLQLC